MALTTTQQRDLIKVGVGLFGAALGSTYLNEFAMAIERGDNVSSIYKAVMSSTFAQSSSLYPLFLDNQMFAERFVENLAGTSLSSDAKSQAIAYVKGQLDARASTPTFQARAEVVEHVINLLDSLDAAEATFGPAAKLFDNRVTVATYYSIQYGGNALTLEGLKAALANVTTASDVSTPAAITNLINGSGTSQTFTLTASKDSINEGETNTFTVTAATAVTTATTVTFQLKVDAAGDTAQAADFNAGSFNPVTVTIPAGSTTATFNLSTITNDGTEVSEKYTVQATVGGQTLSKQVTILDGSLGAGQTFTLTKDLDILPGMKGSNDNTVTAGNDTVIGVIEVSRTAAGVTSASSNSTLNATDLLNTGEGTDTVKIVLAGAVIADGGDYSVPTNFEGAEIVELQSSATFADAGEGVILNTSTVSGLTNLNVTKSADVLKLTAGASTDVKVTSKSSNEATTVDGGKAVTVALTDASASGNTVTIGATTAAKGAVDVSVTGLAVTDNSDMTLGALKVTGGSSVSVTQKATTDAALAAAFTTGTTVTQGAVTVTGDASTTTVTVKQDAAKTEVLATNKTGGVTESASVKFTALTTGQTLILGGLTFTAAGDVTASEAAAAFANLINGTLPTAGDTQGSGLASKGTYTGAFTGWTSGAASGDTVVFTSTTANSSVGDLANSGTGSVTVTTTEGKAHSAGAAGGVLGVKTGVVSVTDGSATIKTITVDGYADTSSTTGTTVLETLNLSNGAGTFTAAAAAATLALNVEKLGSSAADAALTFTAAPTTLNVKSTGNTFINLTAAATQTLNVSGTGVLDIDTTDLAAVKTVKVTETAGLKLHADGQDTITSVDTSATTGAVTLSIDGGKATYTGGAGVDTVTLATTAALTKAIALGAGDDTLSFGALNVTGSSASLDGGEGTDTLSMLTATAAALDAGKQSFYTNFERLTISDAGADATVLDLANLGFTNYVTTNGSAGTLTLDKLANNGTVVLNAAPTTGVTVQITDAKDGTADVLNLVTNVVSADVNFNKLTAANVETVNIKAVDTKLDDDGNGTNDPVETATLTLVATKATKITVTGDSNLTLTNTGNTKVAEIDASALTGKLTVTAAGTTASKITGGAANDVLTASASAIGTVNATGTSAAIKADDTGTSKKAVDAVAEVQTLTITADDANDADETLTITYGTNASGSTGSVKVDIGAIDSTDKNAVATAVKNALNADGAFSALATASDSTGVVTITYNTAGVNINTTVSAVAAGTKGTLAGAGADKTAGAAAVAEVTTVLLTDGTTNSGLSAGDTMSLKVGGTTYTYTATGTVTMDTAGGELATLIAANSKVASATYNAGSDTLTITAATAGTAGALSVSTYAVTDANDVGATADTLIGGAGDDTLNANAAMTQLTGGTGNDLFVIGTASLNVNSYATITDFTAGDLIKFTGADSFAAVKVSLGGTAVFQDYANAAMNSVGVNDVAWFQYGGDTYIVMDAGSNSSSFTNGEDLIVKLTGTVDLSTATFNLTHQTIGLA